MPTKKQRHVWLVQEGRIGPVAAFSSRAAAEAWANASYLDTSGSDVLYRSKDQNHVGDEPTYYVGSVEVDAATPRGTRKRLTLDTDLGEVVSVRTASRLLAEHGITTVGQCVCLPLYQLWSLRGMGHKSLAEIMDLSRDDNVRSWAIKQMGDAPPRPQP